MNASAVQLILSALHVFTIQKDVKEDHIPSNNFYSLVRLKKIRKRHTTKKSAEDIFNIFEFQMTIV